MAFRIEPGSSNSRGFTLIELLVVMVIIASLLAIAAPRYFHSLDHSKEVVLQQDLSVMREAIDQYFADHGHYPETLSRLYEDRYIRKIPIDPITKSADTWVVADRESSDLPGVYDVHSGAQGLSSNGTPFAEL